MTDNARRVAVVADAAHYVGPELSRLLAARGHDLVLGDARAELVTELESTGATVVVVEGVSSLANAESATALVNAALETFGRVDAAAAASGRIIPGRFVDSTEEQFQKILAGCMMAPYHFLKAVVPAMVEQGSGQILVITSAAGARPTKGAALYSAARAGATMLVKNVAGEVARTGVQVNAVGTNFMDFPEFRVAMGADDPDVRAQVEAQVPMRRLGTMLEFAAFCGVFLDGTSNFTTGQFVAYAGGWA